MYKVVDVKNVIPAFVALYVGKCQAHRSEMQRQVLTQVLAWVVSCGSEINVSWMAGKRVFSFFFYLD